MPDTITITDNRTGKQYELPVQDGAIKAMDLRKIKVAEDPALTARTGPSGSPQVRSIHPKPDAPERVPVDDEPEPLSSRKPPATGGKNGTCDGSAR